MPPKPLHLDHLQIVFHLMNTLMRKGVITYEEARDIIMESLPEAMPEEEREHVLNTLIKKADG